MHEGVQDLVQVVSVGTRGRGVGTARPARVLSPGQGMAMPSLVPHGQPEGKGEKDLPVAGACRVTSPSDPVASCCLCYMCAGLYCPLLPSFCPLCWETVAGCAVT